MCLSCTGKKQPELCRYQGLYWDTNHVPFCKDYMVKYSYVHVHTVMVCTCEHTQEMVYGKGGEVYTRKAVVIAEYLQGLVEQINAISKRLGHSLC